MPPGTAQDAGLIRIPFARLLHPLFQVFNRGGPSGQGLKPTVTPRRTPFISLRDTGQVDAERVAAETARELMGLWSMLHRLNGSSEDRAFAFAYRDVERYLRRCGFAPELVRATMTTIQFEYPEPEF